MKIITIFLILNIYILSFANSFKTFNLLKRSVTYDEENFVDSLSKECRIEYENSKYNKCMPDISLTNYKEACLDIKTEKCKKFYDNPLKYYPVCKENPEFAEEYSPIMMKSILQGYEALCQTNEKDELCPFAIHIITDSGDSEVLYDQCKSEKCTESLLNIYKNINLDQYAAYENSAQTTGSFNYQDLNSVNNMISILESDKCKSLHVTTSDSSTIKRNNTFFITLELSILLLLWIFY